MPFEQCPVTCDGIRCELAQFHNTPSHGSGIINWPNLTYKAEVPKLIKNPQEYNHYFKNVEKFVYIDVYRVLELFGVTDPCIQHAVKKLLVAGGRGSKNIGKDIEEAIVSLKRWQQMRFEDGKDSQ